MNTDKNLVSERIIQYFLSIVIGLILSISSIFIGNIEKINAGENGNGLPIMQNNDPADTNGNTEETSEGGQPPTPHTDIPLRLTPAQQTESTPLFGGRIPNTGNTQTQNPTDPQRPRRSSAAQIFWVIIYFMIVMGIFVGILYLIKRYMPGASKVFAHPGVEILGRTPLDARRYLALVRFGRRLWTVGVSPEGGIQGIGEVSDSSEVTEIMETSRPKTEAGKSIFATLFQKESKKLEDAEKAREIEIQAEEFTRTISQVRENARTLGKK